MGYRSRLSHSELIRRIQPALPPSLVSRRRRGRCILITESRRTGCLLTGHRRRGGREECKVNETEATKGANNGRQGAGGWEDEIDK